jgi:hypothetical protein
MEQLPKEIILIILNYLPITGKRNLIRCNKQFNNHLWYLMEKYESEFMKIINENNYLGTKIYKQCDGFEKYTLEIVYDGYENLLLDRYIIPENAILYEYGKIYFNSAAKNYQGILKILMRCNKKKQIFMVRGAAYGGNLKLLKWCISRQWNRWQNNWKCDNWICTNAAKGGHLEVLKWAWENGCAWNRDTCAYAAKGGYLEVLKWLREKGCDWDSDTCIYAASNGYLEVLKWARENGCEWHSHVCAFAALNGHLEVLKWARENGCPE